MIVLAVGTGVVVIVVAVAVVLVVLFVTAASEDVEGARHSGASASATARGSKQWVFGTS